MTDQIRFTDGAGYEQMMGKWSCLAGDTFLNWLAPPPGLRWIDVGCGNGAFTELLVDRCAPAEVQAIDPSEGQLSFARTRPAAKRATFQLGDAMALPFPDRCFDAAVMALVIFFVPDPAKGVAEMVRVVAPGGTIAAYAWDIPGGGFPLEPIRVEMRAMGLKPANPPSVDAARTQVLRALWTSAGMKQIETREITVERTFANFDDFWKTCLLSQNLAETVAAMSPTDAALLKSRVRQRLPDDANGTLTYSARANAIKGMLP